MLKHIEITGYKSLVDVQVDLQPLVVLFGPNGAGKSNLLDALQLLSRMAISPTLKAAFEPPYRGKPLESFSFDDGGIPGLLARESARFSIQADVELSPAIIKVVEQQIQEMKRPGGVELDEQTLRDALIHRLQDKPEKPDLVRCWSQAEPARKLVNLQSVPILIVTSEASYHAPYDHCTVRYLAQAGVKSTFIRLPDVGVHGNGHMMMLEKNSDDIAKVMADWLDHALPGKS